MSKPYTDAELDAMRQDRYGTGGSVRWLATVDALKAEIDGMARAPYGTYQAMRERAEAAEAERDRLREEIRIREQSQIPMIPRGAQAKMEALEAQRDRLREALEQIAWLPSSHTNVTGGVTSVPVDDARKIARDALEGKP